MTGREIGARVHAAYIVLVLLGGSAVALAQNVSIVSSQDTTMPVAGVNTGGTKLAAVACNVAAASRWTGWINVSQKRNIVFDVSFVDANASAAAVDVRCEASTSNATVADAGFDLPTVYATTTAAPVAISSMAAGTWRWVDATTGANPGTSAFELYIENIPAPFIECLFVCGGAAADNITVFARGVNP